jgi:hypothetical protein
MATDGSQCVLLSVITDSYLIAISIWLIIPIFTASNTELTK